MHRDSAHASSPQAGAWRIKAAEQPEAAMWGNGTAVLVLLEEQAVGLPSMCNTGVLRFRNVPNISERNSGFVQQPVRPPRYAHPYRL